VMGSRAGGSLACGMQTKMAIPTAAPLRPRHSPAQLSGSCLRAVALDDRSSFCFCRRHLRQE
jgi:hypothetical protein